MNVVEFLLALKNMKTLAAAAMRIDFETLARELQKTNPHIVQSGLTQDDVDLLVELAGNFVKTKEIVRRITQRSARNRRMAENARNN